MKFIAIVIAIFAAAAAAAPAAELEERQLRCSACKNGKQICCSAVACYAPTNC